MKSNYKILIFYVVLIAVILVATAALFGNQPSTKIIYSDKPSDILRAGKTFLTAKEIHDYGTGRNGFLYGWSVDNVRKYEKPLTLDVFGMSKPPLSWGYCYL